MRKQLSPQPDARSPVPRDWLDLVRIATVTLTSEDPDFPIENALDLDDGTRGWRAAGPGQQSIRLVFDSPQRVRRIHVHFVEPAATRTQEIALAWAADPEAESLRELLRQQWNFSAQGSSEEIEGWDVDLPSVAVIELRVTPDIGNTATQGPGAIATLKALRVAAA